MEKLGLVVSVAVLVLGVLLYLLSVSGVFWQPASPPGDVGLLSTTAVIVLFGLFGILLHRVKQNQAA